MDILVQNNLTSNLNLFQSSLFDIMPFIIDTVIPLLITITLVTFILNKFHRLTGIATYFTTTNLHNYEKAFNKGDNVTLNLLSKAYPDDKRFQIHKKYGL